MPPNPTEEMLPSDLADNSLDGVEFTAHHSCSGGVADIILCHNNAPVEHKGLAVPLLYK